MNRRSFIKVGALPFLSPALLSAVEGKKDDKACVFIFLGGGISHIEFLNPLVNAPVEYRSTTGAVKTKNGWDIGGSFSNMAEIADKFTAVRSFHHNDGNHYTATHYVMTSHPGFNIAEGGDQKEPSYGSFVANKFNESLPNGVPTYIKTSRIGHDKSAWLGSRYAGFDYDDAAIKNLSLNIPEDRFKSRLQIMDIVDKGIGQQGIYKQYSDLKDTAGKVIVGTAGKALDVNNAPEDEKFYYKVGQSGLGRNLLIARRSIEAGSKFVTVEFGGWDMHGQIGNGFPNRAAEFDAMYSKFILDLEQRGMLKNTLVVVTSEFGRTPKINQDAGRDHYPLVNSLVLAGGGYEGGLIGGTDDKGTVVNDKEFLPRDLAYTTLHHFGIDKDHVLIDPMRRPRHVIDNEAKLIV